MTAPLPPPAWLPGLAAIDLDDAALHPIGRLLDVVAPQRGTVPVAVQRTVGGDDGTPGPRTWEGAATLWDDDRARFGISVDEHDVPTGVWVAKPMAPAAGITLPGVRVDVLWMILAADVDAEPWPGLDPTRPPLDVARHLVGVMTVAGRALLVRLDAGEQWVSGEIDFAGVPTDVERAVLGRGPGAGAGLRLRDLAALFGTDHDPDADLTWLPPVLRDHDLLTLDRLHLTLGSPADGVLVAIGAGVSAAHTRWPLIPGLDVLTVDNLAATFDVDHPLDPAARSPRVAVTGEIGIGSGPGNETGAPVIDVGARWPDLAVTGHLRDGHAHPVQLSQLLAAAHLPALDPDPKVTELLVTVAPGVAFALHARITDLLQIPLGGTTALRLADLAFDIALGRSTGGGTDRTVDVDVRGLLLISDTTPVPVNSTGPFARRADGDHGLVLSATGDQGGSGWTLRAGLAGDPIPFTAIGDWISGLFGIAPVPSSVAGPTSSITRLDVALHTATRHAELRLGTTLAIPGTSGAGLDLGVALTRLPEGGYAAALDGRLAVGGLVFDLLVAHDPAGQAPNVLVAAFRDHGTTSLGQLLAALGVDGLPVPVVVGDALVAVAGPHRLAMADLSARFDLADIPVIGSLLPPDQTIALDLRFVGASGGWNAGMVAALNAHLPEGYPAFAAPTGDLPPISVVAALTIGAQTLHLEKLGIAVDQAKLPPPTADPAPDRTAQPPVTHTGGGAEPVWTDLQRSFGPVHLRRVGARFADGAITLLLDGGLSLGGFGLDLQGLSVTTPLTTFRPSIGLDGLGLDLRQGDLQLSGAFLRIGDEFAGAALLRAGQLALSAIGAYGTPAATGGQPSLFVYAVLDYPLGGPAFFFVTGLAAGFGYNRRIVPPTVDRVQEFPLVKAATTAAAPKPDDLLATLASFSDALPPSPGDLFAAAGIRFTSFKTIDSFALLIVSLGTAPGAAHLRLDLLGTSTLIAPASLPAPPGTKAVPPIAEIHLGFRAQLVPEEGFLGLEARLTAGSYVLSENCHLTGGAAFYAWLAGPTAGDFVVTVGGYHPDFHRPAHYPQVPRVGVDWQVTPELVVKGDLYYALTGHAIMAGGHLEATYASGAVGASFTAGIDLLATWQPFTYSAAAYVHVAAHWHALHFELGVDVTVWGPPFAGVAEVDLTVTRFTIPFGAAGRPTVTALDWAGFRAAFLPPAPAVCAIACTRGMIAQVDADHGVAAEWVASAHDLVLEVTTRVPATAATRTDDTVTSPIADGPARAVAPMGPGHGVLSATLDVQITRDGGGPTLSAAPVLGGVPAALWGDPPAAVGEQPDVNAHPLVPGLTGLLLRAPAPQASHATGALPVAGLLDPLTPTARAKPRDRRARVLLAAPPVPAEDPALVAVRRAAVLAAMGIDPATDRPGPPDPWRPAPFPLTLTSEDIT